MLQEICIQKILSFLLYLLKTVFYVLPAKTGNYTSNNWILTKLTQYIHRIKYCN